MIKIQKIFVGCIIGLVAFNLKPGVSKAAEMPIAGIDLLFNNYFQNVVNEDVNMKEYLSSDVFTGDHYMSFAKVTNYVNIRSKANEESEILGKLYNNAAARILKKEKDWYKVKSGTVTGYIKAEYLITGAEAEKLSNSIGTRVAVVNTTTLKLRDDTNIESPVITLIPMGEELKVKKEAGDWINVLFNGEEGYVSADYVNLKTEYEEAVSIQEEKERLEAEEAARNEANAVDTTAASETAVQESHQEQTISNSSNSSTSSIRSRIVNYALQFNGNPYVWGGTSLTNGTDCSGFTQSVFRDNGYSIPRTSRTQAMGGRSISINNIQPGDLIFYERNNTINHVGIYIGNGKVISASSPETGIRITAYNYRQPYKAVSYLN